MRSLDIITHSLLTFSPLSSGVGVQYPSAEGFPQCCHALGDATTGCFHHSVAGAGPKRQDGEGVQVSVGDTGLSWMKG